MVFSQMMKQGTALMAWLFAKPVLKSEGNNSVDSKAVNIKARINSAVLSLLKG